MPVCFTFIGWHNCGKTTVAEKVVKALVKRGYSVGVMKSTKHTSLAPNPEGSDSRRFKAAGASSVALACPDQLIIFDRNKRFGLEYLAFQLFPEADIVVGEGFKNDPDAFKIEVARKEISTELLVDRVPNVVALVSDFEAGRENWFHIDDIDALVKFIERTFLDARDLEPRVEMFGDHGKVRLKHFIRNALKGVLFGFISSLRNTQGIKALEIRIKK